MRKMFSRGVLSVAVCIGVGTGSLKADFEADLLIVLSFVFSREAVEDPLWWMGKEGPEGPDADAYCCEGPDADAYCCELGELYRNFCKEVRNIVQNNRALWWSETKFAAIGEKDPDAFAERAFCLLQLSRDLYGTVSEYALSAWDLDEDDAFQNIDALLLSECRYVFVRRLLELSRFILRHHAKKFGLGVFIDTEHRKPDEKVLAEILKPFAKGDVHEELKSKDNNLPLIQNLHVLSNVFDEFFADNDNILKEVFGDPLSSWFGVPTFGNETDYWEYVLECSEVLSDALWKLSGDVWDRVERMLSVKRKLSPEQKKQALPFLKGEENVSELLKATWMYRVQEIEIRKKEQQVFEEAAPERRELKDEIAGKKEALETKKNALSELQGSNTEISKKKELENEIQKIKGTIEMLETKRDKLSFAKNKREMQRKAAQEGITKEKRDRAVLANYVQLPGKCDALLKAFLYYQTIMWNVFTDDLTAMRGYGRKIYDKLKIKEPELTEDFEEEYHNLPKGI